MTNLVEITGFDGVQFNISKIFQLMEENRVLKMEKEFQNQTMKISYNNWRVQWSNINIRVTVTRSPIIIDVKFLRSYTNPIMSSNAPFGKILHYLLDNIAYFVNRGQYSNKTGISVGDVLKNMSELKRCGKERTMVTPLLIPSNGVRVNKIAEFSDITEAYNNKKNFSQKRKISKESERIHVFFLETLRDSRKTSKHLDDILHQYGDANIKRWANNPGPEFYSCHNFHGSSLHLVTAVEKWDFEGSSKCWIPLREREARISIQLEKLLWLENYIVIWPLDDNSRDPISHLRFCQLEDESFFTSDEFIPILHRIKNDSLGKH